MTTTHRTRPPMTMTQVLRPSCELFSPLEMHSYFGPGINSFGSPCLMVAEKALWWSTGTVWDAEEDTSKKATTVFAANDALLKQGSQAAGRKHHLILAVGQSLLPPAPGAVCAHTPFPLPGQWLDPAHQDKGESTAIYAPRHVKADIAGTNEVAVLYFSNGGANGFTNLAVCNDPMDHDATYSSQTPNTVFLGMSEADRVGALLAWRITAFANGLLKMIVDAVVGHFSTVLAKYARRALARVIVRSLRGIIATLRYLGVQLVSYSAGKALDRALNSIFDAEQARFDHTAIDDGIADLWDEYVVSP